QLPPWVLEIHVGRDLLVEQDLVGERRTVKPRMDLGCEGAPADLGAALEYERLDSGLGKIERRRQRVVSRADDDGVVHRVERSTTNYRDTEGRSARIAEVPIAPDESLTAAPCLSSS